MRNLDKYRYEYASHRVEELLPLVTEDMPATHPLAMELAIMSDVIIAYEKKHYPIGSRWRRTAFPKRTLRRK